jgi:hypothetical protein
MLFLVHQAIETIRLTPLTTKGEGEVAVKQEDRSADAPNDVLKCQRVIAYSSQYRQPGFSGSESCRVLQFK